MGAHIQEGMRSRVECELCGRYEGDAAMEAVLAVIIMLVALALAVVGVLVVLVGGERGIVVAGGGLAVLTFVALLAAVANQDRW